MKSIRRKVHRALVSLATIGMLAGVVQTVPAATASAAEQRPTFTITTVASGLNLPWDVAQHRRAR